MPLIKHLQNQRSDSESSASVCALDIRSPLDCVYIVPPLTVSACFYRSIRLIRVHTKSPQNALDTCIMPSQRVPSVISGRLWRCQA